MKNLLKRNFLFLSVFASVTNFCYSSPVRILRDTTFLAENSSKANSVMFIESNVIYPKILEDQKSLSLKYVEKYSRKNRDFLMSTFKRGESFFPKIANVLTKHGLPTELKVIIAIESGFKSSVVSKAGAVGYWQMMDEMACDYGLKIRKGGKHIDERKNLEKSTAAAAKFLKTMYSDYDNNILLTVAAYNCGAGNVRKAIKYSGVDVADFWKIKEFLPKETRSYVMHFIALNVIFNNYEKFKNKQLLFQPKIMSRYIPLEHMLIN